MQEQKWTLTLLFSFLLLSISQLNADLERKPWFYPPYEFHVGTNITPSFFSDVQNGYNPIGYGSTNFDWQMFLLAPFSDSFDAQIQINFFKTTMKKFNLEALAAQVRKQFFNDVQGDWISAYWGFNYRFVLKNRLSDVATTYHNISNFEIFGAIGKEFSKNYNWFCRTFLWGALGQANTGYPWGRFDFSVEGRTYTNYILGGGVEGYFGTGPQKSINVDQFNSYARIKHQSVDIYAHFGYQSKIWGILSFKYVNRPFARAFPDSYNAFMLTYDYPFSF